MTLNGQGYDAHVLFGEDAPREPVFAPPISLVQGRMIICGPGEKNPGLKDGKVFPSSTVDYRVPSSVAKGFKAVSEAMKLKFTVTPHDLRRSFQNLLRKASVNIVVQQALMGHSSDGMTLHYSHVDMQEKRQAQEKVIDLLSFRKQKDEAGC